MTTKGYRDTPLQRAARLRVLRERAALGLAAAGPAALIAGGLVAVAFGQPVALVAVLAGLASGLGLWHMRGRSVLQPRGDFADNRLFLSLIDQLPLTVWIEDWSSAHWLMVRARSENPGAWLDQHPQDCYRASAQMRVLHYNDAAMVLYRASSREAFSDPDFETFLTRESGIESYATLQPLFEGSSTIAFDGIDQTALDGSHISVRTLVVVLPGHGADWSKVMMVETDITEEVEAFRKLARSERRHRELVDEMPVAVWLEDWSAVKAMAARVVGDADGDLVGYLGERPELVDQIEDAMEVLHVNCAAMDVYGVETLEQLDRVDA
ncbi:MAG: hypothetical protein HOI34_13150 [Rhodospirillaceae bacterium]|nr:hypothetical protein [Rhodospirillaceae bacterium]MBT6204630.1 hypothetical protein [Rhodospirillaceae bacterium]MBT6512235.1 hypothetical protein [Rhodospirillaceae bacterium]MBT7611824.1 hypothetical protein [Rhodospirillaceae bacterium]MBT7647049.1 hypothetical protein [Rhodospirillaceae bacterium]